jgi:hypothetical protein
VIEDGVFHDNFGISFLFIICCWYNSTVILLVWEWTILSSQICQLCMMCVQIIFLLKELFGVFSFINKLSEWKKQFPSPGTL